MIEPPDPSDVLDASALLAFLKRESGWQVVEPVLGNAIVSSVNWSEVVQKSLPHRVDMTGLRGDLGAMGLRIESFTADDAEAAAILWPTTRPLGLSLGDRACLALGLRLKLPIWTADRIWSRLALPINLRFVR